MSKLQRHLIPSPCREECCSERRLRDDLTAAGTPRGHRKQRPARGKALFLCVGDSPAQLRRAAASSILSSWLQGPGAAIFPRTQLVPGGPTSPSSAARLTAPPGQCRVGHRGYRSRHLNPTPDRLGKPQASPRQRGVGHVLRDGRVPAPPLGPPSSCPPRGRQAPKEPNPQPLFVSPGRWRKSGERGPKPK